MYGSLSATLGHDGIRAQGSQSMKPASKARLVVGFPRAGPTCFAITVLLEQCAWVG